MIRNIKYLNVCVFVCKLVQIIYFDTVQYWQKIEQLKMIKIQHKNQQRQCLNFKESTTKHINGIFSSFFGFSVRVLVMLGI